jgi:hypothetical protein
MSLNGRDPAGARVAVVVLEAVMRDAQAASRSAMSSGRWLSFRSARSSS